MAERSQGIDAAPPLFSFLPPFGGHKHEFNHEIFFILWKGFSRKTPAHFFRNMGRLRPLKKIIRQIQKPGVKGLVKCSRRRLLKEFNGTKKTPSTTDVPSLIYRMSAR